MISNDKKREQKSNPKKATTKKEMVTDDKKQNRPEFNNTAIRGTGEKSLSKFRAPAKKLWLHIGKCEKQTATDQITDHINSQDEVTQLRTSGYTASCQVGIEHNENLNNTIYDPSYWPKGVAVKLFKFFRNQ